MGKPELLLHICCAPCSTHAISLLAGEFEIIGFFYNPNIHPPDEHSLRLSEAERFCKEMNLKLIVPPYQPSDWFNFIKGYEKEPEGGERCLLCFRMRLEKTARAATSRRYKYFGTTLSISPHKDTEHINRIGTEIGEKHGLYFYETDFKKGNGYRRSCELSKKHGLYRQDYCGCIFSYTDKPKPGSRTPGSR